MHLRGGARPGGSVAYRSKSGTFGKKRMRGGGEKKKGENNCRTHDNRRTWYDRIACSNSTRLSKEYFIIIIIELTRCLFVSICRSSAGINYTNAGYDENLFFSAPGDIRLLLFFFRFFLLPLYERAIFFFLHSYDENEPAAAKQHGACLNRGRRLYLHVRFRLVFFLEFVRRSK